MWQLRRLQRGRKQGGIGLCLQRPNALTVSFDNSPDTISQGILTRNNESEQVRLDLCVGPKRVTHQGGRRVEGFVGQSPNQGLIRFLERIDMARLVLLEKRNGAHQREFAVPWIYERQCGY